MDIIIKRAVKETLSEIGLSDEKAYDDLRELRGVLETWRATKKTVGRTIAQAVTTAVLLCLAAGFYFRDLR